MSKMDDVKKQVERELARGRQDRAELREQDMLLRLDEAGLERKLELLLGNAVSAPRDSLRDRIVPVVGELDGATPKRVVESRSCGLWSPSGYRSSRPVTVHAVTEAEGATGTFNPWASQLQTVSSGPEQLSWLGKVPDGHPAARCRVSHCPVRKVPDGPPLI